MGAEPGPVTGFVPVDAGVVDAGAVVAAVVSLHPTGARLHRDHRGLEVLPLAVHDAARTVIGRGIDGDLLGAVVDGGDDLQPGFANPAPGPALEHCVAV